MHESDMLLYRDISMDSYIVDRMIKEVMKQGDETLNTSLLQFSWALNASLLCHYNFFSSTFNASLAFLI